MHRLARPEIALVLASDHVPEGAGFALASDAELSRRVRACPRLFARRRFYPQGY